MKREKIYFNSLLARYAKYVRKLRSLRAANRNERRQKILSKHIERLHERLLSLKISLQRTAVASTFAVGAMITLSNEANAQSFTAMQTNPFGLQNIGGYSFSNPSLGDIDGDGDLDLISGYYEYDYDSGNFFAKIIYFENIGTNTNPSFAAPQISPFGLTDIQQYGTLAPTFVDLDGDGDLDIVATDYYGNFVFFENTGTASAPSFAAPETNPFSLSVAASYSTAQPAFADLDNDGDLDMIAGDYGNYAYSPQIYYFENIGTANAPLFGSQQINPFSLNLTGYSNYYLNHPTLVDMDGDGDFDLIISDRDYDTGEYIMKYFENTGTASAPVFGPEQINPFGLEGLERNNGYVVADLDGDGILDILAGDRNRNFYFWKGCESTTSSLTLTEACQYTAPSGAVYDVSGIYTDVIPNASNCDSIITINLTIQPIADISFTNNAITICDNGPATLQLSSSQNDVAYYLRNDLNDTIVSGPIIGDGNALNFSTGSLTASTTYNVYAEKLITSRGLLFDKENFSSKALNCGNDPSVQISGTEISLEAWIYPTEWQNSISSGNIINNEQNSPDNGYMLRCGNDGQLGFTLGNGSWTDLFSPTGTLVLNTWQHVAATYDGTTMTIYVDGNVVASSNAALTIGQSNQSLVIGNYTASGRPFIGTIDEVRIWSVARSETEIQDNMGTCLTGSETGLEAYYQFEDGTGSTTVTDLTTNGNNGTLQNMDENTDWVSGSSVCASCEIEMTQTATVTVNPPLDNTVTNNATSLTANLSGASYQWLDCDNGNTPISGETSQSFTPTTNGNYAVEISTTECTVTSSCESITLLGIEGNELNLNVNIYPNPANDIINIDLGHLSSDVQIRMVSSEGKEVYQNNVTENLVTINFVSYPQGVYIVEISNGTHRSYHKVIKN